jgi:fructose-1,6-bisphosphatase/inositol monophosphatase family enzyme
MTGVPYAEELLFAQDFAARAGDHILKAAAQGYRINVKSDTTPVTDVDIEINRRFIEQAAGRFPHDGVLGEELSRHPRGSRTWVIDPIDGTQHLILGIPVFMISIALVQNGKPIVAVARNPSTRDCYWATAGVGAVRNGVPIRVSSRNGITEPMTIAGSGATPISGGLDADGLMSISVSPVPQTTPYRFPWPSVFSGTRVAEGTWDADLYGNTSAHDVAAVCLLVREAGGTVTDRSGTDQRYDESVNGCVLSNGQSHGKLIELWGTTAR